MPRPSSPELLVLLGLRLTSLAEPEDLASRTGLARPVVDAELARAAAQDWARYREGRLHGWALTAAGRDEGRRLLAEELAASGERPAVQAAYERFMELNPELLATCTAWQLVEVAGEPVVNQHDDPDYDQECVERLRRLDARAAPVVADLADRFERFSGYGERLARALARVGAGEQAWFTSPGVDSYHTVWFELHEHLLATLDIERVDEEPARAGAGAPTTRGDAP